MKTTIIRKLLILNLFLVSFLFLTECNKELAPLEKINNENLSKNIYGVPIAFPDQGKMVSFNLAGDTVFFRKIDSLYVFQGDIIFTESQIQEALYLKGAGISIFDRYWPHGIIPYKISEDLSQQAKDLINEAVNQFNGETNVKFIQRTSESSYCEFVKSSPKTGGSNATFIGRIDLPGSQAISIKDGPELKLWEVEHEMCHALGMLHEQCRSDRDKYIIVHEENIKPIYKDEFRIEKKSINPTEFDFESVMMFPPMVPEMAIDKSYNIITDLYGNASWGYNTSSGLSTKDIEAINCLYPVAGTIIPVLLSPKYMEVLDNGCYSLDPIIWQFNWSRCPQATSYNLYVIGITDPGPTIDVEVKDPGYLFNLNNNIWIGNVDPDDRRTLWKVRAKINGEWGEWSKEGMFDVEYPCMDYQYANTPEEARDILFWMMKNFYYWYNMPEPTSITEDNKDNYASPFELLEAMRYRALDRWSFVFDYDAMTSEYAGNFAGHGIFIGLDQEGKARISSIYNNSPLYPYGVRRGWIIKKINNVEVTPDLFQNYFEGLDNLLGPPEAGITNTFLFANPLGEEVKIRSTKSEFLVNSVLKSDILQLSSGPTGHLVIDAFIDPTYQEMASAFATFKANGIKDLILDLRYNSGGLVGGALDLSSYIAASRVGSPWITFRHNDQLSDWDYTSYFESLSNSFDLPRVVIITTRSTASAAELVINGLKPYVNVVTIGDITNGKPVGMYAWDVYPYFMAPIMFAGYNASNQGDYYDGIYPAKFVPDDITRDFSDPEELCLKEAINYLETGFISTKSAMIFKRNPVYSEKPEWMNNAIIDKFNVLKNHKHKNARN
jgi:carboxyl-terminal processing protease